MVKRIKPSSTNFCSVFNDCLFPSKEFFCVTCNTSDKKPKNPEQIVSLFVLDLSFNSIKLPYLTNKNYY